MKKEIKNKYNGEVIFAVEFKDNTIKKTVSAAIATGVMLTYANLDNVDLEHADLRSVDLGCASLRGANFRGANLERADLRAADLRGADLRGADLRSANLTNANLQNADLGGVILGGAYLREANLQNANLQNANLQNANLQGAKEVPFIPSYLPVGEFIAWKKCQDKIIKLKILEDSKRSRATSDKCRCDKALVLGFEELDGTPITNITEIVNKEYAECHYKVGEVVYADKWDADRWNECSHGIHFFIDRQSAIEY